MPKERVCDGVEKGRRGRGRGRRGRGRGRGEVGRELDLVAGPSSSKERVCNGVEKGRRGRGRGRGGLGREFEFVAWPSSRSLARSLSKSALVIVAEGSEEMEMDVITVDLLRRGGVNVILAGLEGNTPVLCSREVVLQHRKVSAEKSLADALAEKSQYDAVILPGGLEGSERCSKSSVVGAVLKHHEKLGKIVATICAGPMALLTHGIARGKKITSYPSTKDKISGDYQYVEGERVVVDGNIVTSRGPGTAYWYGLKLVEMLTGKEKADQVEQDMPLSNY